jgi:hypothetical protein
MDVGSPMWVMHSARAGVHDYAYMIAALVAARQLKQKTSQRCEVLLGQHSWSAPNCYHQLTIALKCFLHCAISSRQSFLRSFKSLIFPLKLSLNSFSGARSLFSSFYYLATEY